MNDQIEESERVVRLKIIDGEAPPYCGEATLRLKQVMRFLKGRREVWFAEEISGGRKLVAKCFLSGKKQVMEFRREVRGLKQLSYRKILSPSLLFTASDKTGGLWVVTDFIPDSQSVSELLVTPRNLHSSEAKRILNRFSKTLIEHWKTGVYQTDAHLRNFLWDGTDIYTVDVGSIIFRKKAFSDTKKLMILARMLGRYGRSFRDDFFESFSRACLESGEVSLLKQLISPHFRRLCSYHEARNLRRIKLKSQRDCSEFRKIRQDRRQIIHLRDLEASFTEVLQSEPDQLMKMGQRLKSGNTCTIQQIKWEGRTMVVKRYNSKSLSYQVRHALVMSRAMKSWVNGIVMQSLQIPTVRPLAAVEERRFGLLKRAYFIMELFEGESVVDYSKRLAIGESDYERLLSRVVDLFERLKELRVIHGDFKGKNILVNESELCLIDTDGLNFLVSRCCFQRRFRSEINRFLNNWPKGSLIREDLKDRLYSKSNL